MATQNAPSYPNLEFHLRQALDQTYKFSPPMFALESGKFKIDYHELQNLIHRMGELQPDRGFRSSELHGMGLLSLLSHKLIRLYRNQVNPSYIQDLTTFLETELSPSVLNDLLGNYLEALPSDSFKSSSTSVKEYLKGQTKSVPNTQVVVEELLVHILALNNPAFDKYDVVFKEDFHKAIKTSDKLLKSINKWSAGSTGFGSSGKNVIELLMEPILAAPDSIEGQLAYIRKHWSTFLGSHLMDLLRGLDLSRKKTAFVVLVPANLKFPAILVNSRKANFIARTAIGCLG